MRSTRAPAAPIAEQPAKCSSILSRLGGRKEARAMSPVSVILTQPIKSKYKRFRFSGKCDPSADRLASVILLHPSKLSRRTRKFAGKPPARILTVESTQVSSKWARLRSKDLRKVSAFKISGNFTRTPWPLLKSSRSPRCIACGQARMANVEWRESLALFKFCSRSSWPAGVARSAWLAISKRMLSLSFCTVASPFSKLTFIPWSSSDSGKFCSRTDLATADSPGRTFLLRSCAPAGFLRP
mmetsp:Transcript_104870/g.249678  ORF Transcript_104870/g.249678 Transcript_104870/m.249678 type:complete len:241 (-) Transcript_104870:2357-3079(-)